MYKVQGTLIAYCENRALRALLRGAAPDSGLEFREVSSLEEARRHLGLSCPALLIVGVAEIHEEHLALVRDAGTVYKVPAIVVVEGSDESTMDEAIKSGAIACLGFEDAMRTLVFLVDNVVRDALLVTSDRERRILSVSDQVALTTPDYCLTDGQYETHMPPIPGTLLKCLALHPNDLVPFDDLIQAAWGRSGAATVNVLHQQVYRVRAMLSEYGVAGQIKSVRGRVTPSWC